MNGRFTVRGVVFSAIFAAIAVVLSFLQINLGFSPVPITLGNMGIMLMGAFLGGGYGFLSALLLVVLGGLGLPLFDGQGGLGVLLGPSGGYVWMYPLDALFVGLLVTRIKGNGWMAFIKIFLSIEIFGSLLCYVTGVPWLGHVLHVSLSKAMLLGFWPYLPGDALKALATTAIILPVRRLYPAWKLTGSRQSQVAMLNEDTMIS